MAKKYNTPHRTHVIKTRLDDEEYAAFTKCCRLYGMSQTDMIRKAITGAEIHPIIRVGGISQEYLNALNVTNREIIRVGNNLNQISRAFNTGADVTAPIVTEIKNCIGELTALRFDVLKEVGDAVGNDKTYRF